MRTDLFTLPSGGHGVATHATPSPGSQWKILRLKLMHDTDTENCSMLLGRILKLMYNISNDALNGIASVKRR